MEIDNDIKINFRDQLRVARASALRDSESFQEILFVIERFGSFLTKGLEGLGSYEREIEELVNGNSPHLAKMFPDELRVWHTPFNELYVLVRKARNDALHQGAVARNLTKHALKLALILEEALTESLMTVSDYMVKNPICAFHWQPISFIRQQMLENSFSYLPVFISGKWRLISDIDIALYLGFGSNNSRKKRYVKIVQEAMSDGLDGLKPYEVSNEYLFYGNENIEKLEEVLKKFRGQPILVVASAESPQRLVGILTAFDLL